MPDPAPNAVTNPPEGSSSSDTTAAVDWLQVVGDLISKARQSRDPIQAVAQLYEVERTLPNAIGQAVQQARHAGATWADIGEAGKTPRQAAWRRWTARGVDRNDSGVGLGGRDGLSRNVRAGPPTGYLSGGPR
jgi:hypothetical protein